MKHSDLNISQVQFVQQKSHADWPGIEPGPPRWGACSQYFTTPVRTQSTICRNPEGQSGNALCPSSIAWAVTCQHHSTLLYSHSNSPTITCGR